MLREAALSCLVFEWEVTTKREMMWKDDDIFVACADDMSTIVLAFRPANT